MKGDEAPHPKTPKLTHDGGCFKQKHASRADAIKALVSARKRNHGALRLHTYFCDDCRAWHITKMGT